MNFHAIIQLGARIVCAVARKQTICQRKEYGTNITPILTGIFRISRLMSGYFTR